MRLFSFTARAFLAEAFSDSLGQGTFDLTDGRPLVSLEELAALNTFNGHVGNHRFVEVQPATLSSGPPSFQALLALLVFLGLTLWARRTLVRP